MKIKLQVKLNSQTALMPVKAYFNDACFDIFTDKEVIIPAHSWQEVSTGLSFACPNGYCLTIRPRSSSSKKGLIIHSGTIDAGYRGEISVFAYNTSDKDYKVLLHDRIAQIMIDKILPVKLIESKELPLSERGKNGFGSTGR